MTQTHERVGPTSATATTTAAARSDEVGLDITIRTASGTGQTLLSAFDHALHGAGVADFNLITLSSVIPTASTVRHVHAPLPGGHGDLLFCVRAEAYADQPGEAAWAGLGWVVDDETGGGLFVEHHGHSEASVKEQIEHSLADMNRIRGGGYGPVQMTLASAVCTDQPVCALVLAAYRVSAWHESTQSAAPPAEPRRQELSQERSQEVPEELHEDLLVAAPPAASPAPASGPGGTHSFVLDEWTGGEENLLDEQLPVGTGSLARVSMEKEVDYLTAKRFYRLYVETFGELDTLAAGRQLLHADEFLAEMLDPRVHKYVAWDEHGVAIGMTTFTTDLETVPWVSPTYFAHAYPDHHARGAVYYLGFSLVHPEQRGTRVLRKMLETMAKTVIENRGVVGWDMCRVNDERGIVPGAERLLSSMAKITTEVIDQQTYYAMTITGPSDSAAEDV